MDFVDVSKKKDKEKNIFLYYGSKIKVAAIIFIVGIVIGCIFVIYSQNTGTEKTIEFISIDDLDLGRPTFGSVFKNNLIVGLIMCLGIFGGRFIPQIVLFLNAVMLGIVASSYLYVESPASILLSLLPHAWLEVLCLLFCASIGMNKYKKFRRKEYIKLASAIIIGFAIAALLETHISFRLAQSLYEVK